MSCRFVLRALAACLVVGLSVRLAASQQPYKVLTSSEILVYQEHADQLTSLRAFDPSTGSTPQVTSATRVGTTSWWDIVLRDPMFKVSDPPMNYLIAYQVTWQGTTAPEKTVTVSPSPRLSIQMNSLGHKRIYDLSTNVALKVGDQFLLSDSFGMCANTPSSTTVTIPNVNNSKTLTGAWTVQTAAIGVARLTPGELGIISLCLAHALPWPQANFAVDPNAASALFPTVSFDPSLRTAGGPPLRFVDPAVFGPPPAPASKDAANFYANLQIAAGTGASGAWGLDGKIDLLNFSFLRGIITLVSATANTGNNTSNISGSTYTDSIAWMLPASWAKSLSKGSTSNTLTLTASPKYETDYNFDRENFLFSGDALSQFRTLYQPQSFRSKSKNGVLAKYGDPGFAKFGYELEFHGGIEAGSALMDTTVKNKKKTQSITLPAYGISRAVPQVHGLLQRTIGPVGLFSFDSVTAGRYLFQTENTVREAKDGSLSIKHVSGWKALHTLTTTWTPPRNGNVGIAVTYKDGFDAPKYARVNSVLVGVLIQF